MKINSIAVAAVAMAALLAGAGPTLAQSSAASAPTPLVANGPGIPGLCVLSTDYVIGASAVGKFVATRLGQLKVQAEAELNGEGQTLQADEKALDAQRASLTADVYDQRAAALQIRERELQRKLQLRNAELQATQEKAVGRIIQEAKPIMQQAITERNCSILVSGGATMAAASSMDITPLVTQRLDAKIQQFAFDREHIDPGAGATQ